MNPHEWVRNALEYAEAKAPHSFEGVLEKYEKINTPQATVEWDPPLDQPCYDRRRLSCRLIVGETLYSENRLVAPTWNDPPNRAFLRDSDVAYLERQAKASILHAFGRKVGLWPESP